MLYFLHPFLGKELVFLDYCIRNGAIYIKLNENGTPVVCGKSQKYKIRIVEEDEDL